MRHEMPDYMRAYLKDEAENALMEHYLTNPRWLHEHVNDLDLPACERFSAVYARIKTPQNDAELAICAIADSLWRGLEWAINRDILNDDYIGDAA